MKKSIGFLLCNLLLLSSTVFALNDVDDYSADKAKSRDPKINVQIYIPSLLFGIASGDVNFKVADKFSFGPQISSFSYGKYRGYSAGVTANYALFDNDVFGDRIWLLNPHIGYTYNNIDDIDNKKGAVICGANLVYQWMWKSGINARLGVGVDYSSSKPWLGISDSHFGGTALFSLGYAF